MATKLDILHYDSAFLIKFCTMTVQYVIKIARPAGNFCTEGVQFPRISHCVGAKKGPTRGRFLEYCVKNWVLIRQKTE